MRPEDFQLIARAASLAKEFHAGQMRRDGITLYITHPERVARRVEQLGGDGEAVAAAWLHDTLEDTMLTAEGLRARGLPREVVRAVELLTKRGGSYQDYLVRLQANPTARIVKIADLIDNLSDTPSPAQLVRYGAALGYLTKNL